MKSWTPNYDVVEKVRQKFLANQKFWKVACWRSVWRSQPTKAQQAYIDAKCGQAVREALTTLGTLALDIDKAENDKQVEMRTVQRQLDDSLAPVYDRLNAIDKQFTEIKDKIGVLRIHATEDRRETRARRR
jgi:hypothetical protein